jgi:hypothetical protein
MAEKLVYQSKTDFQKWQICCPLTQELFLKLENEKKAKKPS